MTSNVHQVSASVSQPQSTWRYWWGQLRTQVRLTPLRIALAYLVLGLGALYFSDVLLVWYFADPLLSQLQAIKGGVEVAVTAGFIFVLARGREAQLQEGMAHLDQQRLELQVLHRVIRHNLRNDLNVIYGYAHRIRDRAEADELDFDCSKILDAAEKMLGYTDQANRIRQITEEDGRRATLDLTEVVPRLLETHPLVTPDVEVSTTLPEEATVRANRMLESALGELVTNAIEHSDMKTPKISIEVLTDTAPSHMVEIRVADNGPGIPTLERDPLLADKEDDLYHLSGLGLWFVKWTVRHSGGEFQILDGDPAGTTVVLQLPKTSGMFFPDWLPVGRS